MKDSRFHDVIVKLDKLQCGLRHANAAERIAHDDEAAAAALPVLLEDAQALAVQILNQIHQAQGEAKK